MNETDAASVFQALANADRLRVIRALVTAGYEGLSAGEVARQINASPSRASFHLSALAEAGLVSNERRARSQLYRVEFDKLGMVLRYLLEDCCRGCSDLDASAIQLSSVALNRIDEG